MSDSGDLRHPPAEPSSNTTSTSGDHLVALTNLSAVRTRMDSLQTFLAHSVHRNVLLPQHQMDRVAAELVSGIHDVIVNGAALLSASLPFPAPEMVNPKPELTIAGSGKIADSGEIDGGDEDLEIVEIDAVELLAEHIHFCEICGKGFKRDANLRMHMRAHGNRFKTPEALSKSPAPEKSSVAGDRRRFSCPYAGCNRNKNHGNFRPLKSAICVKNHFKRSHCPKMYACNRCRKKSFSVVADLRSHQKHCGGESRWRCSCGTTFSRKDKLFGHVALFEGHMPAIGAADDGGGTSNFAAAEVEERAAFDGMMIGFGSSENRGMMDESVVAADDDWSMSMMEEFLNF